METTCCIYIYVYAHLYIHIMYRFKRAVIYVTALLGFPICLVGYNIHTCKILGNPLYLHAAMNMKPETIPHMSRSQNSLKGVIGACIGNYYRGY